MGELGVGPSLVSSGGYAQSRLVESGTVRCDGVAGAAAAGRQLTILGAVACAANAAGLTPDLFGAAKAVAQPFVAVEPDLKAHDRYRELLADYIEATELLTPLLHRLAERQTTGAPHVE